MEDDNKNSLEASILWLDSEEGMFDPNDSQI